MTSLPPIQSLAHSPDSTLTSTLDTLFEPSPPLHTLSLPILRSTTFPSYAVLITAINAQLTALAASEQEEDIQKLSEILCSHPRLGEKKVDSEQSRKEQAQLQQGGDEEKEKLASLNREYEERFPGLRYVYVLPSSFSLAYLAYLSSPLLLLPLNLSCSHHLYLFSYTSLHCIKREERCFLTIRCSVFVNARPRTVIMENMRARIDRGDIKAERLEGIQVSLQVLCVMVGWWGVG